MGREEVPARLRQLLNVESGLNDGLALPIVVAMLAVIGPEHFSLAEVLTEVALGVGIGILGHVHALYQSEPGACPLKFSDAWAALDVGFDGHEYQVWSLDEIVEKLRPRLAALDGAQAGAPAVRPVPG